MSLLKESYALLKSSVVSRWRNAATDSWSSRSDTVGEFHVLRRRSYEGRSKLFLWLGRRGHRVQLIVGIGGWDWQRPADTCWTNSWVTYCKYYKNSIITSCAGGRHNIPPPLQVDLCPFDLEYGVRVACYVGYLCANFSLPRPLYSRLKPAVRDRQTSDVVRRASSLNASALWGRWHNNTYYTFHCRLA